MKYTLNSLQKTSHFCRTCRQASMSNVLTDFVSIPATAAGTSADEATDPMLPNNRSSFKVRSQSLIGRVRKGFSQKKRQRSQAESFDMEDRRHAEASEATMRDERPAVMKGCLKNGKASVASARTVSFDARVPTTSSSRTENGEERPTTASDPLLDKADDICPEASATTAVLTLAAAAATATNSRLQLRHVQHCNERRRLFEDNLAAVCMGFVLVFLVCHFPRLLLNIHELITIKEAMMCGEQGHHPFSVWSMVTISVSHFLLVLNSATNILVYCLLSSKFREECNKIIKSHSDWLYLQCSACVFLKQTATTVEPSANPSPPASSQLISNGNGSQSTVATSV